jgi:hypothetical protein
MQRDAYAFDAAFQRVLARGGHIDRSVGHAVHQDIKNLP